MGVAYATWAEPISEFPDQLPGLSEDAGDTDLIRSLQAQLATQQRLIAAQAAALAHSRKVFDRSSAAARIGVWECTLPDEQLTWTDVVYDIFDLPRGAPPLRGATLKCYPEASARELTRRRDKAIADRTGFSLETDIISFAGVHRWIRITATVECVDGVPVRIFGMKQDITEEKILADRNRYLAEFDTMTGLANRSRFQAMLSALDTVTPGTPRSFGALLLIDLDEFKPVNDSFGHAAGDDCLREAARRISSACGDTELIARIGGDEFAVLLRTDARMAEASDTARAIIDRLATPMACHGHQVQIGASIGIALVDDCTSSQCFMKADTALYAAKKAGRNTFRVYKGDSLPAGSPQLPHRFRVA
jgi:diguanylate cyclase (GGDEF)-like protein